MIFDTDNDGVLTFIQVKNALNVLGKRYKGKNVKMIVNILWWYKHVAKYRTDMEMVDI